MIEERNTEVSRIRAICSSLEDENTTLSKRCTRLEEKNEELRECYNNIGNNPSPNNIGNNPSPNNIGNIANLPLSTT